ncbi:MAG TPA: 3-phosphoserine/phosphohydroxythreonine transaminase, partial [Stenotrophomonas sp.]|nr:3-phosphoserine/phosphohydroxythreonine transaminase [Stenotrophomonas sp.]
EPLDVRRYGVIYAGAQKNLGPVGIAVMIIRRDLLERSGQARADIFDYRSHVARDSMLNTPPTWNWYLAGLVFKWMLAEGGVVEFAKRNAAKAALVYGAIDASGGFYRNEVAHSARSRMNIPFFLPNADLDARFVAEAKAAGLLALKGHKVVGGIRASLYNAMPMAGAEALVAFMADFQQRNG